MFRMVQELPFKLKSVHRRGVTTGAAREAMALNFNFKNFQCPKVSVSNIRNIAFYRYLEIL